jgi:Uma2 family endonuclease
MSIATPSAPVTTDFAVPPFAVRRFSVAEYQRLTEIGMLTEDDSVELLEGWIVRKMTKNPRHDATIDMLSEILWRLLPAGWFPRTQNVLITPDSAPEPDVVIAQGRPQDYVDHHPTPRDVALVIEVAESSLDRDWQKRGIYARAGVAVYWIVDLNADRLEVFTEPDIVAEQFQRHEQLRSSSLANISLPTGEIVTLALADILQTPAE